MTYAKLTAAVVATIASAIVAALVDGAVSDVEWINVAIAGTTAAAVFTGPNVPGARYTKSVLAVLGAVLTLLVNVIADGVTVSEWLQLLIAAAGAVGVYAIPNTASVGPRPIDGDSSPRHLAEG